MANVETIIAKSFLKMAEGLENGSFADRPKIALTGMAASTARKMPWLPQKWLLRAAWMYITSAR